FNAEAPVLDEGIGMVTKKEAAPGWSRRAVLAGSVAAAGSVLATTGGPAAADVAGRAGKPIGVRIRWWGNNSWEFAFGDKVILVDPWVTRFKTGAFVPG